MESWKIMRREAMQELTKQCKDITAVLRDEIQAQIVGSWASLGPILLRCRRSRAVPYAIMPYDVLYAYVNVKERSCVPDTCARLPKTINCK